MEELLRDLENEETITDQIEKLEHDFTNLEEEGE